MRDKTKLILESKAPMSKKYLAIDGSTLIKELPLAPGKVIGDILKHLPQLVLDNPNLKTKDILLSEAKQYITNIDNTK